MKYLKLFSSLILLLVPFWLLAQIEKLNTTSGNLSGRIDLVQAALSQGNFSSSPGSNVNRINWSIQNGDLYISYQLNNLEEDHFYEVVPTISLDGQKLLLAVDEFRGDLGRPVSPGRKTIIWLNPLERYINLAGELAITVQAIEWGEPDRPYDCALGAPTFTTKQKMPYLLAAGVGVASIGVGQLFKKQSEDAYDLYRDSNASTQQSRYDDANGKNHMYLILNYAGIGILAADAVLYLVRQGKYKRDLRNYNNYCQGNKVGFQPILEMPGSRQQSNGNIGLKMTVKLGR